MESTEPRSVRIVVPTKPVGQPRHGHRIVKPKNGREFVGQFIRDDHPVRHFKRQIKLCAAQKIAGQPFEGPLTVSALFVMPRPKHKIRKTKANPRYSHTSKPDIDNIFKAVCDALNKLAWHDDSQVCEATIRKVVASGDELPHAVIEIKEFELITDLERSALCLPF